MNTVIPISQVMPDRDVSRYAVRKMMDTLTKQGQIEPLQVALYEPITPTYITFYNDSWGAEVVHAALQLGWPTLLVSVTKKYEE